MATIHTDYTLPEFCFLDANSHLGNLLEGRTVLQHIRSYTILEVVALSEVLISNFTMPTYEFEYKNFAGVIEKHLFVLHFSLAHEEPLPVNDTLTEIFEKCAKWYCNYLQWEDNNILKNEANNN